MPEAQVKSYVRNGRPVRGYQRRVKGRMAAISGAVAHGAAVTGRNVSSASSKEVPSAEKQRFLAALNAELRAVGASPADLINDKMNGAAGKNPKAHAALLAALRKTGYRVRMRSDDTADGVATKGSVTIKIADLPEDGWDGVTYFDKEGRALGNRTRKPRDWSQPGKR